MNDEKPTPDSIDEAATLPRDEEISVRDAAASDAPIDTAGAAGRDDVLMDDAARAEGDTPGAPDGPYGVGPFSLREVVLGGVWLLAFIISFFPIYGPIGEGVTVWSAGIDWVLTIGVPTAAVFLLALRRLSPDGIRRVGSLGIDQFASVAFSVSAVVWLSILWNAFVSLAGSRVFVATWVVWVEFILMLAGVVLTVFAPIIPPFADDFRGRKEIPAHRVARPTRRVVPRPARPAPARPAAPAQDATAPNPYLTAADYGAPAAAAAPAYGQDGGEAADPTAVLFQEPEPQLVPESQVAPEPEPELASEPESQDSPEPEQRQVVQAFWALSPVERDVVDELGIPIFRVGPTAWALVIEDRGETFVVRHEDGRVGYLHDTSGVTRG